MKKMRHLGAILSVLALLFGLAWNGSLTAPAYADSTNLALHKTAVADSKEADTLAATHAFDGDTTGRNSRWASAADATSATPGGPHWIYVDLGQAQSVRTIRLYWEQRKANGYQIQISTADQAPAPNSNQWVSVKTLTGRPSSLTETITLDKAQQARFVRLYIDHNTYDDPDGGVGWGTVSLYEMEVFSDVPALTAHDIADGIAVSTPSTQDTRVHVTGLVDNDQFTAKFVGADYEQVVGADLTIYRPLVDTTVTLGFKVTNKSDKSYVFREVPVTIPGSMKPVAGANAAPAVLPELREWAGGNGQFKLTKASRVVYSDDSLKPAAEALANDYGDLFGTALSIIKGSVHQVSAGDIYLGLTTDTSLGLQDEGYLMTVTAPSITVLAFTPTGAYWSTRTILQAAKNGNSSIPVGTARDYPLYKTRGFMLDVGRKTFSLDYLKQVVKEMSWYKMNDFQVHLNDNYIWVEEYTNDTVKDAYSGFRLESDMKAGGNDGLNKADLTSTDMFYTKDAFRSFISDSRDMGVHIVPEFDMPAHSLAFTKVRPDLRTTGINRGLDHLNLRDHYDEAFDFVTDVWDEYLTGKDPVFADADVVHVGADEYEASAQSYRTFVNDIFDHVEDTGHTARVWGSLTQLKGTPAVDGHGRQMNIWNTSWANPSDMYDLGFDLINTVDGAYYIVPNATYYYDYLNPSTMYNSAVNTMGSTTIPAGDPQMLGGVFAVWNDMTGKKANGMSEYDIYDRISQVLPLHAARTWGKGALNLEQAQERMKALSDAPGTNFGYAVPHQDGVIADLTMESQADASHMGFDIATLTHASLETTDFTKALRLNGGNSYASINPAAPDTIGLNNTLRVKVKRLSDSTDDQILFESPYGSIKAVQAKTGQVGLSREGYDYSFDYTLPVGVWTELEFRNALNKTTLLVNGTVVGTVGNDTRGELKATMMFPLERIGSTTAAFDGFVDDVRVTTTQEFHSTMPLDDLTRVAQGIAAEKTSAELAAAVKAAQAVIAQVAPSAEEIQAAMTQLNNAIGALTYTKADYRRVDAYLSLLPQDLSVYTEESQQNIARTKARIQRNMPLSLQSTVDAYEDALVRLLSSVAWKPAESTFVDSSHLTATSSSAQDASSTAGKAIDGDASTIWHSQWSITTMPHWLQLDIDEPTTLNAITYQGRQSGNNGRMKGYTIEVSDDAQTWTKVGEGTAEDSAAEQTLAFNQAVTTTHVKITWVSSYGSPANSYASAAEIKLHQLPAQPDLAPLTALIERARSLKQAGEGYRFNDATWTQLSQQIEAAQATARLATASSADVEKAKRSLDASVLALRLDPASSTPEDPDTPSTPDHPSNPDTPTTPGTSDTPDTPDDSDHAATPSPSASTSPTGTASTPSQTSSTPTTQGSLANTGVNGPVMVGVLAAAGAALALGIAGVRRTQKR